jgi:hypothetical protein
MLHMISMSTGVGTKNNNYKPSLNLSVIIQGNVWVYYQNSQGGWSPALQIPSVNLTPNPTSSPQPFVAILGVDEYGLLALDEGGILWSTTQTDDGVWSQGFWPVVNSERMFAAFDAAQVEGFPLLIAETGFIFKPTDPNLLYTQVGSLFQSNQSPLLEVPGGSVSGYTSIAVAGIDPSSGPPEYDTPIAVVFVANKANSAAGASGLACFTNSDPSNDPNSWQEFALPAMPSYHRFDVVALVSGNPNGALQAILLLESTSSLFVLADTSGTGSNWALYKPAGSALETGLLPFPFGTYGKIAAASGNDGYLQVVGLRTDRPYNGVPFLAWQDGNGIWSRYSNSEGKTVPLPVGTTDPLTDLAMGTGSYGRLQVAYVAQNGKILRGEQGEDGTWLKAHPLP